MLIKIHKKYNYFTEKLSRQDFTEIDDDAQLERKLMHFQKF